MANLYVLIGLPGCGKSTWAHSQGSSVVSSDEIRKELWGDEAIQGTPSEVFRVAHARVRAKLKQNKDTVFDACNINRKDRRVVIEIGKQCGANIIGVVFRTSIEECKRRNANRERIVPEFVYDKMLRKFEFPLYSEGIDNVVCVGYGEIDIEELGEKMVGFDQKNHHHTANLDEHCRLAAAKVENNSNPLYEAAKWHDIGKLFTQSEPDENGDCHYFGHHNYGAYVYMTSKYFDQEVCKLINYHMLPYLNEIKRFEKKHKDEPNNFWNNLMALHQADLEAH